MGITTDVNSFQLKAPSPIDVTEFGIVTVDNKLPAKIEGAITVIDSGIVTDVNKLFRKAPSPIVMSEFGKNTHVN